MRLGQNCSSLFCILCKFFLSLKIADVKSSCLLFKKGEVYKKVDASCAEEEFFKEIRVLLDE